jgi:Ser/Thr protein kinase RdoA (MazF antagonist)
VVEWLTHQAVVLSWCHEHNIAAPELCLTQQGEPLARNPAWCALLTTYTAGTKVSITPAQLYALAGLLGRLHRLGENGASTAVPTLPDSWWHPLAAASERALAQLAIVNSVPSQWQTLFADCHTVFETIEQLSTLPIAVIHGDCWAGNAIHRSNGEVMLIDWEHAGRGIALLDIGALLGDCFAYPATHPEPDLACVEAVVAGYTQERLLSSPELSALPTAIRFGAAFRGALRFGMSAQMGWSNGIQRGQQREQARFAVSEEIAQVARSFAVRQ